QKLARLFGIVGDDADNGAVGRIEDRERDDVNMVRVEQRGKVVESSEAILGEHGELLYGVRLSRGDTLCAHAIISHRKATPASRIFTAGFSGLARDAIP